MNSNRKLLRNFKRFSTLIKRKRPKKVLTLLLFMIILSILILIFLIKRINESETKNNAHLTVNKSTTLILNQPIDSMFHNEHLPKINPHFYRIHISQDRNASISIGIPTVKRNGTSYLNETVTSLLQNLSEDEKIDVLFVVFISEVIMSVNKIP